MLENFVREYYASVQAKELSAELLDGLWDAAINRFPQIPDNVDEISLRAEAGEDVEIIVKDYTKRFGKYF